MELTEDIIRKHAKLIEAKVTVKAHTAHSKKGKVFNVKQYDREIARIAKQAKLLIHKQDQAFESGDNSTARKLGVQIRKLLPRLKGQYHIVRGELVKVEIGKPRSMFKEDPFRGVWENPDSVISGLQKWAGGKDVGLPYGETVDKVGTIKDGNKEFHQFAVRSKWQLGKGSKRSKELLSKKSSLEKSGWQVEFGNRGDDKYTTFKSPYGMSFKGAASAFAEAAAKAGPAPKPLFPGNQ